MYILFAQAITWSTARASSVSPSSYTNAIFNQAVCMLFYDCFLSEYNKPILHLAVPISN